MEEKYKTGHEVEMEEGGGGGGGGGVVSSDPAINLTYKTRYFVCWKLLLEVNSNKTKFKALLVLYHSVFFQSINHFFIHQKYGSHYKNRMLFDITKMKAAICCLRHVIIIQIASRNETHSHSLAPLWSLGPRQSRIEF